MRSYLKIYGPPTIKAIKELEKLAINMPQVCIMDSTMIVESTNPESLIHDPDHVHNYFIPADYPEPVSIERCSKIISKSGEMLGDNDFFFEWFKDPSQSELNDLIGKIDEVLTPLGCKYSITTK